MPYAVPLDQNTSIILRVWILVDARMGQINAIRSAEEMERARKRKVAASEVAATAATAYLTKNSKR